MSERREMRVIYALAVLICLALALLAFAEPRDTSPTVYHLDSPGWVVGAYPPRPDPAVAWSRLHECCEPPERAGTFKWNAFYLEASLFCYGWMTYPSEACPVVEGPMPEMPPAMSALVAACAEDCGPLVAGTNCCLGTTHRQFCGVRWMSLTSESIGNGACEDGTTVTADVPVPSRFSAIWGGY